jgi:diadenosine tetraphosphatase ApaH/serine/threonine PP2A family protein phosphatase
VCFGNKYLRTEYEGQCWWFDEYELKLVETEEQLKINYREMSPDTPIKVSIDGNEFEVPLKDMLRVLSKSSAVMDKGKVTEFYIKLNNILTNGCGLSFSNKDGSIRYVKDCGVDEDFFEPYFSKQEEKEALLKDLEVKYNSL